MGRETPIGDVEPFGAVLLHMRFDKRSETFAVETGAADRQAGAVGAREGQGLGARIGIELEAGRRLEAEAELVKPVAPPILLCGGHRNGGEAEQDEGGEKGGKAAHDGSNGFRPDPKKSPSSRPGSRQDTAIGGAAQATAPWECRTVGVSFRLVGPMRATQNGVQPIRDGLPASAGPSSAKSAGDSRSATVLAWCQ